MNLNNQPTSQPTNQPINQPNMQSRRWHGQADGRTACVGMRLLLCPVRHRAPNLTAPPCHARAAVPLVRKICEEMGEVFELNTYDRFTKLTVSPSLFWSGTGWMRWCVWVWVGGGGGFWLDNSWRRVARGAAVF